MSGTEDVVLRVEVRPRWPLRIPVRSAPDGVLRVERGVAKRLLVVEGTPVVLRAAQPTHDRVVLDARGAERGAVEHALDRWRFALGVDEDLRDFHDRFRWDPLIGRSLRANPGARPYRRPEPFEALAWAVTEQLIEFTRAAAIQRRIVYALGPSCPRTGLRSVPTPASLAGVAPAQLEGWGLAARRALALRRAAREVASGRVDLHAPEHERAWSRLRAIPEIGTWTVEMLALAGQGRYDQVPAGDLSLRKLVGRSRAGGNPRARADEDEVRETFARYAPYGGLAATHALRSAGPNAIGNAAPALYAA